MYNQFFPYLIPLLTPDSEIFIRPENERGLLKNNYDQYESEKYNINNGVLTRHYYTKRLEERWNSIVLEIDPTRENDVIENINFALSKLNIQQFSQDEIASLESGVHIHKVFQSLSYLLLRKINGILEVHLTIQF